MFPPLSFSRRLLPALCLLLAGAGMVRAADDPSPVGEGEPFTRFWSPRDYGGTTQCLCMTQDARGVMFIGNRGLILEYDGTTWRHIPMPTTAFVPGVAYDARTDTVFVGLQDDVGYLQTEPGGAHTFVSLHDRLPADAREVGRFFGVFPAPEGVYFVGSNQVLRWRDGEFTKTWKVAVSDIVGSHWAGGHLYVTRREWGLRRLEGEEFVTVTDDARLKDAGISAVLALADGSLLLGTPHEGMFTVRGGMVEPLACPCDAALKTEGIARMLPLRDGSLAVATNTGGLLLLDRERRFRSRVDRFGGLRAGEIYRLMEDAEGGLWAGMQTGVARVETDSPFSVFRAGPEDEMSSTYTAARWLDTLAVGNDGGIFRLVPADPAAATNAHLEHVPGTQGAGSGMKTVPGGVVCRMQRKVVLLDAGGKVVPVAGEITGVIDQLVSAVHPGRMYVIDLDGRISQWRRDEPTGRWIGDGTVAELGGTESAHLSETPRGDLWVGTAERGLFRVQIAPEGPATVTSFFKEAGPLRGVSTVDLCAEVGPLVITTTSRLWRFDEASQTIEPLGVFGERFTDGSVNVDQAISYGEDSLWTTFDQASGPNKGERFYGRALAGGPAGAPGWQALPHKLDEIIGHPDITVPLDQFPAPLRSVLLVGTTGNGIVHLDVPRWEAQTRAGTGAFATLIRRAFTTGGEGAGGESPILKEPLPYARNAAHFEFAAVTLALGAAPKFQTRLVGFGTAGDWSEWSERASVDYLNLPEGSYTFEVRSRNSDGQTGSLAAMGFRVLPPWQRSPWAYAGYALAAALGVWALVRWRGRQLRRRNAALESLVEARTSELARARDDAETANRAKSAFLANMSHELRTPLNAVLGYTQLLLKQPDLSPRSRERVTVIGQSGGHLLSLVNEVLDLSKVEAGKLTLSPFDFALGSLLDEMGAAFRPRVAEKGLVFTENRAPGLPATVHTDPSRLRQVLFNLLSNAVKFTHRGGVTLTVRPKDDRRVCFEVADTGVGIAPEDQRDIFLAFYQAGESHLSAQGTGLGLTISQRLVELLGGRIELESASGQGSRFWFDLPLLDAETIPGASPRAAQDTALGKITGYEGTTRRVLLVDDLAENRRVLRDFLQPLGFEIEEAADGANALTACERQAPDAVLLDLRLGAMHGFEVARALRARTAGTRPVIIAISASVFESDRQQATDAGCDDFLPKPFEEAQLLGVLGRALGLRWVQETPMASATDAAGDGARLPAQELELLRKLSRRGDLAAIGHRLQAWRAGDGPKGSEEVARRLDPLLAAYDLEGIDKLLLTVQPHDKD